MALPGSISRPRENVRIASRTCRAPDCATPSAMIRSTFRASVRSALSARAIAPVSACARYSMPAADLYCTDCADRDETAATSSGSSCRRIGRRLEALESATKTAQPLCCSRDLSRSCAPHREHRGVLSPGDAARDRVRVRVLSAAGTGPAVDVHHVHVPPRRMDASAVQHARPVLLRAACRGADRLATLHL